MSHLKRFIHWILVLVCMLSWGCSQVTPDATGSNEAPAAAPGPEGQETALASDPLQAGDEASASLVEGAFSPPELNLPSLGEVTFSVDSGAQADAAFVPGVETVLQLTDDAGLTWQLIVPPDALDGPQTLTMTALSGLRSGDLPGQLAGVLLEPDGLEFHAPAALTVTGVEDRSVLLTGQHDGSAVDLALMGEQPGAAWLLHFSTAYAYSGDDQAMADLGRQLIEQEKALTQEARQLLKNGDIQVPVPPSIPIECVDKEDQAANDRLVEEFIQAVDAPEGLLVSRLLAVKRGMALLGMQYDEEFTLEVRLLNRLAKKAGLLIKTYFGQEEKLVPVSQVALRIARHLALLGAGTADAVQAEYLQQIGQWSSQAVDRLIEDVINQHDYRKAQAVWTVARWAALVGSQQPSVEEIQRRLQRALTFELQLKSTTHITEAHDWLIESSFQVQYQPEKAGFGWLLGEGQGQLTDYTDIYGESIVAEAGPFPVNAAFTGFDACAGTTTLNLDRFFADTETYYDPTDEDLEKVDIPLTKTAWEVLFKPFQGGGPDGDAGGYAFPLTVNNRQANVVDESVEGDGSASGGEAGGTFEIVLVHKPQ